MGSEGTVDGVLGRIGCGRRNRERDGCSPGRSECGYGGLCTRAGNGELTWRLGGGVGLVTVCPARGWGMFRWYGLSGGWAGSGLVPGMVPGGWYRSIRSGRYVGIGGWVVTGVRGRVNPG